MVGELSESAIARQLMAWVRYQEKLIPALQYFAHIPNGGRMTPRCGARLKAEGVRRGVPDYVWPIPMGGYHGFWLELKAAKGKQSPEQADWEKFLTAAGHLYIVAKSMDEASRAIMQYWRLSGGSSKD